MPTLVVRAVLIIAGYLLGSLSPAYIAGRILKGIDLRQYGSGNLGGSNVGEQLGRKWFYIVGLFDVLKGFVPPALANLFVQDPATTVLTGLAALFGHNWSLYLGLTGGRGLATTLGVLFAWDLRLFFYTLILYTLSDLMHVGPKASLVGIFLLAPVSWLLQARPEVTSGCVVIALLIVLKRLEANRLPLPRDSRERMAVLWRRFWTDSDVPPGQPWQERQRIR